MNLLQYHDIAIQHARQTLDTTPHDSPDRVKHLVNLANRYNAKFLAHASPQDLYEAIRLTELALEAISPDNEDGKAKIFNNLSNFYSSRFDLRGLESDVEEAITKARQALDLTPSNSVYRAARLSNLSHGYSSRFKGYGEPKDLDDAIVYTKLAVETSSLDSTEQSDRRNNLALHLSYRFMLLDTMSDLTEAIVCLESVVAATSHGNMKRASYIDNLSTCYAAKFERQGYVSDLDKAINLAEEAVESASLDHTRRGIYLHSLSNHYAARFKRLDSLDDLDKAISLLHHALKIVSVDRQSISMRLSNLSSQYSYMFLRRDQSQYQPDDLDTAIHFAKQAVDATPHDSPNMAAHLHNLSVHYSSRFKKQKTLGQLGLGTLGRLDLEKAIETAQQALQNYPTGSLAVAKIYNNLSNFHYYRYSLLFEPLDLAMANDFAMKAVEASPFNSPDRAIQLSNLSSQHHSNFLRSNLRTDLEKSIKYMNLAFQITNVAPLARVQVGNRLITLLLEDSNVEEAALVAKETVRLLPKINPWYLPRRDQEYVISQVPDLTSTACSLMLETGRTASEAFDCLELGRGIMASLAINAQIDVTALKAHKDGVLICEKYEVLRNEMSTLGTGNDEDPDKVTTQISQRKRSLFTHALELEEVESQIRQIPGFERFQLPPEPHALKTMAESGSIVAYNVSKRRSDAIIITTNDISALPLGNISYEEAHSKISRITTLSEKRELPTLAQFNAEMKEILSWLWVSAVKPVLSALLGKPLSPKLNVGSLPHVWWITNGIMGLAPLHAAGLYGNEVSEKTMDFVVSSFVPTIKSLAFAREKMSKQEKDKNKTQFLFVSASDKDIDFKAEMCSIEAVIGQHHNIVRLHDQSKEEVLRQLEVSAFLHFDCHGVSDMTNPSKSYLRLNDANNSYLTVNDLAKVTNDKVQLAYLSACSSAQSSIDYLRDETIHLGNAFQLSGCPQVIASIWKADDEVASKLNKQFYEFLFMSGLSDNTEHKHPAYVLHKAVLALLRNKRIKNNVLGWAAFVHIGA